MLTSTGLRVRAWSTSRHIRSEARPEPPGLSTRMTMPAMLASSAIASSSRRNPRHVGRRERLGGGLEAAGAPELRLDSELVERAFHEHDLAREPRHVEDAGRREQDARGGAREVVITRPWLRQIRPHRLAGGGDGEKRAPHALNRAPARLDA